MKPPTTFLRGNSMLVSLVLLSSALFSQTTIISYGSTWKYLDNGSNQGTAWRASGFNDASWASGPAELGYGDAPATTVSYGGNAAAKHITTYFRTTVNIANPSAFFNFTLNVRRDDGVVVYINGTEQYRNNLTAAPAYNTLATLAADDGATPQTTTLATSAFSPGVNTIAVEIHQNDAGSTDLTFDLELLGNMAPVGLINFGDSWKYLDNNTRPAGWQNTGFNDASWASGNSELGYADGPATTVSFGPDANNKYITTYFRKTFNITGLSGYSSFTMNIVRDDGVLVYINGTEVARDNMPGGTPGHATLASAAISGAGETTPISFSVSPCNLVEGTNTIAVEMHQNDITSSDLSFNLELIGNVGGGTPSLSRGPYLQKGSQTAITVRWRTSAACNGRLEVGTAAGSYTTASADEACSTTEHIVTITGLLPDTKYYYRIGTTTGTVFQAGTDNFFTTLPPDNTTRKIRIAAFGDCGRNSATYQDQNLTNYQNYLTTNGIEAPDAWILMGDNAYSSGTDAEYTTNFFGIYGNTLLKNHKLYPSPGNHDYGNNTGNKSSRSMAYHSVFSTPMNGECGGVASGKQNYYSFDIGNIHFLSLDAFGTESDGTEMGTSGTSALKTWLTADLAANTKKWTIAYWHHPPYTKTSHNSDTEGDLVNIRQNFITFLEQRGVDMIVCGHSHGYERGYLLRNFTGSWNSFNAGTHALSTSTAYYNGSANSCPYTYNSSPANHGTLYVVAGSTGASGGIVAGDFDTQAFPFSVNDGGVLYFEVEGNRLDAKMLMRNGTVFDQYTIMKDVNRNTSYTVVVNTPVTLTASWPGTHNWSTAATTPAITVTPTSTGTTNYTVTDAFGCVTDQFSITASSTLPVVLLDYTAVLNNGKVNTSWATSSETNSRYFTVERTQNLRDYELVGQVNAAGHSDTRQAYSVVDHNPHPGVSYYRLSQTDMDNKTHYFDVKKIVNNTNKNFSVKQVANESGMLVLLVNSAAADKMKLKIFDLSGKEIVNEDFNITAGTKRKENKLRPGSYVWEVRNSKGEAIAQATIVR